MGIVMGSEIVLMSHGTQNSGTYTAPSFVSSIASAAAATVAAASLVAAAAIASTRADATVVPGALFVPGAPMVLSVNALDLFVFLLGFALRECEIWAIALGGTHRLDCRSELVIDAP